MQPSRRKFLKRAFLGATGATILSAWWIATSKRRAARLIREIIADTRRDILPPPEKPDPRRWSDNRLTFCWIGHSTVLIDFYGVRILTDPVLGSHVGVSLPLGTAGPKRYVAPALRLDELPPIDVLLLSHAHMDHMDVPSLRGFDRGTFTITASATSDILSGAGLNCVSELNWGGRATFRGDKGELHIEAFEVKHWGQRWPSRRVRGYNGYVLRREGKAILFGGDTAQTPLFSELRSRGPFQAAIMPIGAYQPWIRNHCTPEQAVELACLAGARHVLPVHHQTFRLSHEPMREPIERLQAALHKEPERIAWREIGQTFVCPET